jgi:hypothetical protein
MNVTSVLSALSLNAPWNWVTMSAQNPRREGTGTGVPPSPCFGAASWRMASGVVSGITNAKLTIPATNCELKNFHPALLLAMERKAGFLMSRDINQ